MAWLSDWKHRRKITISSSKVEGVDAFADSSGGGKTAASTTTACETKTQSKFGNACAYFSGATTLYLTDHADFQLGGGTGNFTVEFFCRFTSLPAASAYRMLVAQYQGSNDWMYFTLYNNAGTYELRFWFRETAGYLVQLTRTFSSPATDTWYHIALVRSGNDFSIYVDGSRLGDVLSADKTYPNYSASLEIGSSNGANFHYGYIDELRISNSARYTENFSAPTAAFETDANTKLLMHFEPTAADLTNFPVMIRIDASCGTGAADLTDIFDELTTNSLKLAVTTSDGETQCYVEVALWDSENEIGVLYARVPTVSGSADTELYIYFDSAKADNSTYVGVVGSTPGKAVWDSDFIAVYHLCETPDGANSIKDSTSYANHGSPSANAPALVDAQADKGLDFEASSSNGITLPGKTEVLVDQGPTGHTVTCGSYANVDPIRKKFGTGSMNFNSASAANSYVNVPDHDDFLLGGGSGSFTVDFWVYFNTVPGSGVYAIFCGSHQDLNNRWWIGMLGANLYFRSYNNNTSPQIELGRAWTASQYTWYHVALVRNGNDFAFYVDGTRLGAVLTDADSLANLTSALRLGHYSGGNPFNGNIDDFRISDTARWTANFTPPTSAHSSDANTKLLINFDAKTASIKGVTAATCEAVFKLESYSANGAYPAIFHEGTFSGNYHRFTLYPGYNAASDTRLKILLRDSSTGTYYLPSSPRSMSLDTWYHGAATYDSDTEALKLFEDALVVAVDVAAKPAIQLFSFT